MKRYFIGTSWKVDIAKTTHSIDENMFNAPLSVDVFTDA